MVLKEKDLERIEDVNFNPQEVDFSDEWKVLKVALENEISGRKLYAQYAKTVKNELAKRVFIHLANEELNHIDDIKKFLDSLKGKGYVDMDKIVEPGSLDKTGHFFGELISELRGRVKPSDDDKKSRQVAMGIEKAGYEYYKQGAKATKDPQLKKFFQWLTEQEQSHYMLIRNAFEYADNPESWHAGEEHWLLEG